MGQTLSEPVTDKETTLLENDFVTVGSSSMQGWRANMEDAHTALLSLPGDESAAFFGVYDGHGGANVAKYLSQYLHKYIVNRPEYSAGEDVLAMEKGFLDADRSMMEDEAMRSELSGSTAITVLIKQGRMICANVGDSRAVVCIGNNAYPFSEDHKPQNLDESARIMAAGGFIELNRVNGNLALSRAFGDFAFKKNAQKSPTEQIIIAVPGIRVLSLTSQVKFVLLACDGIWDVLSNDEACQFVSTRLNSGMSPDVICEELLERCLAPDNHMGSIGTDNMTAIIVCFKPVLSTSDVPDLK